VSLSLSLSLSSLSFYRYLSFGHLSLGQAINFMDEMPNNADVNEREGECGEYAKEACGNVDVAKGSVSVVLWLPQCLPSSVGTHDWQPQPQPKPKMQIKPTQSIWNSMLFSLSSYLKLWLSKRETLVRPVNL